MCAAALVTGQSMEVSLPDDLEWAIRLSAGLVPGVPLKSVRKWRKTRLRDFKKTHCTWRSFAAESTI